MLRKIRIKTRLFVAFFFMALFTLIVGITGLARINSIKNSSVKMLNNVNTLNEIYDRNAAIYTSIYNMLYVTDIRLNNYVEEDTKKQTEELLRHMREYVGTLDKFDDIFTPGEMQNMLNLYEIFNQAYIPILNEIIELMEQRQQQKASSIYINRLSPIYNTCTYYLNWGFNKNLDYSLIESSRNEKNASYSMFLMFVIILLSMIASVVLAFAVTKSIAKPLLRLENAASKIAKGELDVHLEQTRSDDEISHMSQKLSETLHQLAQVQQLKLETVQAQLQKEKAESATRAKSIFLTKMSHEIRTPMNAITGMAELALRENMSPTAQEHIMTIKHAGANLLSIINDILDFSKIESGKLEIIPGDYQFSSLINDVVSIIRMRIMDSRLRFVVNTDCNIPNALFGDETRVRQVMLNLLSNAVKYTKKGFIEFSISGEKIKEDTILLTIDVSDSGKGIKREDIGKLFSDFVQVDLIANKGIEGTGLGLAITKNLVNAMDGDISVQSEYTVGSTFTITLPQKITSPEPLAKIEKPEGKSVLIYERREIYTNSMLCTIDNLGVPCARVRNDDEFYEKLKVKDYSHVFVACVLLENVKKIMTELNSKAQIVLLTGFGTVQITDKNLCSLAMPVYSLSVANVLNGVSDTFSYNSAESAIARFKAPSAKILIVDDIGTNLKVAEGLMLPYNMQIDTRLSGAEAIEEVQRTRYDLIFMDHMMPEMDGIETVKHIRDLSSKDKYYGELTIIALTANAVSGTKEMFLANGFNDFLSKPIDTVKLNAILAKWIPKEKQVIIKETDKNAEAAENINIAIEDVDIKKGISMTGGTLKIYMQTISVFQKDGKQKIEEINKSLEAENYVLYTTYVHALKSASASIGASKLSEQAKALELAGKQNDLAFIKSHNSEFLTDLKKLLDNISNALSASNKDEQKEPIDFEFLKTELVKLKAALTSLDSSAIDEAANDLQKYTQAEGIGEKIDAILQNVLIGEYDEAIRLSEAELVFLIV